jgi:putative ABC transport system permease protein
MGKLPLPMRFALRELRSGMRGFRIFLGCIAIGVTAIAGAASMNQSVEAGIAADAQPLLGGDLQARISALPLAAAEVGGLRKGGDVSRYVELRSMARTEGEAGDVKARALIDLKGVDTNYPLYGALTLEPMLSLPEALAEKGGVWGAVIDPGLTSRLGIKVGDLFKVGEATLQLRAALVYEPDRSISFSIGGPRVLIGEGALAATQLVRDGSMIDYIYNIRVQPAADPEVLRLGLLSEFPDAGWRLRGLNQAARGLDAFIDNVTLFLTLVGLTALLTGGIGVANAVRAHLNGRLTTIATLKCLGASADTIFNMYLIQLGILACVGIIIGLVVGAAIPMVAAVALGDLLPVKAKLGIYPMALGQAAIFGTLTATLFTLWPLAKARDIPPVALFRNLLAAPRQWPRGKYMVAVVVVATALAAFTIATAEREDLAAWFVVGSGLAMFLFSLAARCVMKLAIFLSAGRNSATAGRPSLRLALANLYRPGSPTTSVVLSLGLGLSVLVAIALLQSNLDRQIREGLPADAPSMFFIDIQPDQREDFTKLVQSLPGVRKVITANMIRGRVTKIKGVPVADAPVKPGSRWAARGERGISTADTLPEGARMKSGEWWPSGYSGEPLVSVDDNVGEDFHLKLGDTISVNVLGREITAKVASFRDVRWQSGTLNFTFIFSPNALAGAPGISLATLISAPGSEDAIETAVLGAMPNVTIVQVRQALDMLKDMLDTLSLAVQVTAAIALVAGALVLAGAIAAGHNRRIYESVVLKVLGATRADVLRAFVFEYLLLGLATGIIAAFVGSLAAWGVVDEVMHIPWTINFGLIAIVIASCIAVTLTAGFTGTWRAMGTKAAPLLRNE